MNAHMKWLLAANLLFIDNCFRDMMTPFKWISLIQSLQWLVYMWRFKAPHTNIKAAKIAHHIYILCSLHKFCKVVSIALVFFSLLVHSCHRRHASLPAAIAQLRPGSEHRDGCVSQQHAEPVVAARRGDHPQEGGQADEKQVGNRNFDSCKTFSLRLMNETGMDMAYFWA